MDDGEPEASNVSAWYVADQRKRPTVQVEAGNEAT